MNTAKPQATPVQGGTGSVALVEGQPGDRQGLTAIPAFVVTTTYWWEVEGLPVPSLATIGRFFGTYSAAVTFRDSQLEKYPSAGVLELQIYFDESDAQQCRELALYRDLFAVDQAQIQ